MYRVENWKYNDGGRSRAGFTKHTDDCVCRAIAIASRRNYRTIYNLIKFYGKIEDGEPKFCPENGVSLDIVKKIFIQLGFKYQSLRRNSKQLNSYLIRQNRPNGIVVFNMNKHIVAVVNNVVQDTGCLYLDGNILGYWSKRISSYPLI